MKGPNSSGPRLISVGAVTVQHNLERGRQMNTKTGGNNDDQRQLRKRRSTVEAPILEPSHEEAATVPKKMKELKVKLQNSEEGSAGVGKKSEFSRQEVKRKEMVSKNSLKILGPSSPSLSPVSQKKRREESPQNFELTQLPAPNQFGKFGPTERPRDEVVEVDEIPNHLEVLDDNIWAERRCPHCSSIEEIEAMLKAEAERYTRLTEKYERVDDWVSNNRQFSGGN